MRTHSGPITQRLKASIDSKCIVEYEPVTMGCVSPGAAPGLPRSPAPPQRAWRGAVSWTRGTCERAKKYPSRTLPRSPGTGVQVGLEPPTSREN